MKATLPKTVLYFPSALSKICITSYYRSKIQSSPEAPKYLLGTTVPSSKISDSLIGSTITKSASIVIRVSRAILLIFGPNFERLTLSCTKSPSATYSVLAMPLSIWIWFCWRAAGGKLRPTPTLISYRVSMKKRVIFIDSAFLCKFVWGRKVLGKKPQKS